MKSLIRKMAAVLTAMVTCGPLGSAQSRPSVDVDQVLSWFPAETDAINVANGPFPLAGIRVVKREAENQEPDEPFGDAQLVQVFAAPAITRWTEADTVIARRLRGEPVLLAVEGFHVPTRDHPTEHCSVLVFKRDSIDDKLLTPAAGPPLVPEDIDGRGFVVFEDKRLDSQASSFIIAHPRPNVLLISDNLSYLKRVLDRIHGAAGNRALPYSLPDWRYVNTHARFWGLFHVPHPDPADDDESDAQAFEQKIISMSYSFDPGDRTVRVTFFSKNHALFQEFQKDKENNAGIELEKHVIPEFKEVDSGVVEMSALLKDWYDTADFATTMGYFVPGFEVNWFEWVPALDAISPKNF